MKPVQIVCPAGKEFRVPKVLSIILGGGKGSRLYPLTKERSKPAVPFGGNHRIVDIPISNCINSNFKQIYLLTQFNSASLHMHITAAYNFDRFSQGFVEILAAEQTLEHSGWYEGTADAVRKNFVHFKNAQAHPLHHSFGRSIISNGFERLSAISFGKQSGNNDCDDRRKPRRRFGLRHYENKQRPQHNRVYGKTRPRCGHKRLDNSR